MVPKHSTRNVLGQDTLPQHCLSIDQIEALDWSEDARLAVLHNSGIKIYDKDLTEITEIRKPMNYFSVPLPRPLIRDLAWHPDSNSILSGVVDPDVYFMEWTLSPTLQGILRITEDTSSILGIEISPDNTYVALAYQYSAYLQQNPDNWRVELWNLNTPDQIGPETSLDLHSEVTSLGWSPSSDQIVVGFVNGSVEVWDIEEGNIIEQIQIENTAINDIQWFSNSLIYIATEDSALGIWNVVTDHVHFITQLYDASITSITKLDDDRIVIGYQDGQILIMSISEIVTLDHHTSEIRDLDWNNDKHILASASSEEVCIWDVESFDS